MYRYCESDRAVVLWQQTLLYAEGYWLTLEVLMGTQDSRRCSRQIVQVKLCPSCNVSKEEMAIG